MDSITDSVGISLSNLWETVEDGGAWHAVVHRLRESDTTQQLNKTTPTIYLITSVFSSGVVCKANQKNTFFWFLS